MKKMFTRIAATLMAVALALPLLAHCACAANVCEQISGSSTEEVTFTVETNSRWIWLKNKLTIKQEKGVVRYMGWGVDDEYKKSYGVYDVKIVDEKTGETEYKHWSDKSLTLKLKDNRTYTITISPVTSQEMQVRGLFHGVYQGWSTAAAWAVSKTKGITLCG